MSYGARKKLIIFIFSGLVLPFLVFGQIEISNPITSSTLDELINNIINFLFNLALIALPLMFVIAGIFFATAQGEPAKIEQARNLIKYTLIGFVIILLSKGFIELLKQVL